MFYFLWNCTKIDECASFLWGTCEKLVPLKTCFRLWVCGKFSTHANVEVVVYALSAMLAADMQTVNWALLDFAHQAVCDKYTPRVGILAQASMCSTQR